MSQYPHQNPYQQPYQQPGFHQPLGPRKTNELAIISLILGIVGIVTSCCIVLGAPAGVAAIVTGAIGLGQIKQRNHDGYGMAIAGLVCGIVACVFSLIALIINLARPWGWGWGWGWGGWGGGWW